MRLLGRGDALFLDFDGTLAPIVDDPDAAAMSVEMRAAVMEAHGVLGGALAHLGGREQQQLLDPLHRRGQRGGVGVIAQARFDRQGLSGLGAANQRGDLPGGHGFQKLIMILIGLFPPAEFFTGKVMIIICN